MFTPGVDNIELLIGENQPIKLIKYLALNDDFVG
jgi:hypothetical protein